MRIARWLSALGLLTVWLFVWGCAPEEQPLGPPPPGMAQAVLKAEGMH